MSRIAFDCAKCFKSLQLEERIYKKAYEGHTLCLSCRPAEKASQILTEEELKRFEDRLQQLVQSVTIKSIILEVTASHRALYAANAELSFKNMNLQNLITDLNHYANLDHEENTSLKEKIEALEGLNHE